MPIHYVYMKYIPNGVGIIKDYIHIPFYFIEYFKNMKVKEDKINFLSFL